MRELPEPNYPSEKDYDDAWTRDQVLAYEDGLRDAWNKINSSLASDPQWCNGMVLATNLIADMFTASQEKK